MKKEIKCGILAFQGNIEEHEKALERLGVKSVRVKYASQIPELTHLIIPGGESTVMSQFLQESGIGEAVKSAVKSGELGIMGTCAGAILLSSKVDNSHKVQPLQLMDIEVNRNAYGSQIDSFEAEVLFSPIKKPIQATFIRAPKMEKVGKEAKILATYKKSPILVQQGKVMACAFHPEYLNPPVVHEYFLSLE